MPRRPRVANLKLEELEIMCQNAIYICIAWNADVSTTQGVHNVIYIFKEGGPLTDFKEF